MRKMRKMRNLLVAIVVFVGSLVVLNIIERHCLRTTWGEPAIENVYGIQRQLIIAQARSVFGWHPDYTISLAIDGELTESHDAKLYLMLGGDIEVVADSVTINGQIADDANFIFNEVSEEVIKPLDVSGMTDVTIDFTAMAPSGNSSDYIMALLRQDDHLAMANSIYFRIRPVEIEVYFLALVGFMALMWSAYIIIDTLGDGIAKITERFTVPAR